MKAITLTQPWATLVAIGAKKIETRSWRTDYRGPLAIHAAMGGYNDDIILADTPFKRELEKTGITSRLQIPLGAIVATAELVDVQRMPDDIDHLECFILLDKDNPADTRKSKVWNLNKNERAFGLYKAGRYAWLLDNIQMLREPIRTRGALGIWVCTDL